MIEYLRHVRAELAHVAWPSSRTAMSHTLVVLFIAVVTGVIVGALDYVFSGAVSRLLGA